MPCENNCTTQISGENKAFTKCGQGSRLKPPNRLSDSSGLIHSMHCQLDRAVANGFSPMRQASELYPMTLATSASIKRRMALCHCRPGGQGVMDGKLLRKER